MEVASMPLVVGWLGELVDGVKERLVRWAAKGLYGRLYPIIGGQFPPTPVCPGRKVRGRAGRVMLGGRAEVG